MMATYVITGCSRGLGLELARQLYRTQSVKQIITTARQESSELKGLVKESNGRVLYVELDVSNESSVHKAAEQIANKVDSVDVLINNAGSINWMSENIDKMTDLLPQLQVNVVGAHTTTAAMLPLLSKGRLKKVINISTAVGSINWSHKYAMMKVPSYKVSKAALNMLTVQWALSYEDEGFTVLAVSPGWLRTDLGTQAADLSVQEGAQAVLKIVTECSPKSNGKFINIRVPGWEENDGLNQYDGKELPW